jgi:hypothetical protein
VSSSSSTHWVLDGSVAERTCDAWVTQSLCWSLGMQTWFRSPHLPSSDSHCMK